jgi:L-threonylcarbamoyladenylate synthase
VSTDAHEPRNAEEGDIQACAIALSSGHLVAFPTETVYGLGGDASNPAAVARIFQTKGRPADHPLIVHLAEASHSERWSHNIPDYAWQLADALWPGAMTLIVPKAEGVSTLVTGGQNTVGLRVPSHPLAQDLLHAFAEQGGSGVAAPSANRFGRVSPTSAEAVRSELGTHLQSGDLVLEGGPCEIGLESTIIDCTGEFPAIARPGAITRDMIRSVTGLDPVPFTHEIRVSGGLAQHYAPRATVVLDGEPQPGDGLIALSSHPTPEGVTRLLEAADAWHYAKGLYGALRTADDLGLTRICALAPEGDGIAEAIRDRLSRASAGSGSR